MDLKKKARAFWVRAGRRKSLRDMYKHLNDKSGADLNSLLDVGFEHAKIFEGHRPSTSSLTFWLNNEVDEPGFRQHERNSAVLLAIEALYQRENLSIPKAYSELLSTHAADLAEQLKDLRETSTDTEVEQEAPVEVPDETDIEAFIRLLSQFLGISPTDSSREAGVYVPMSGEEPFHLQDTEYQQAFLCYRFSSEAGKVAKSFTVVMTPSTTSPFCYFHNYFKDEDYTEPRQVVGAVLPLAQATYFVGRVGEDQGLKVIAFRKSDGRLRERHLGLVMTFDGNSEIVVSRFLMVPTEIPHHKDADIGLRTVDQLKHEVQDGEAVLDAIRNRVEFVPEAQIQLDGGVLTVDQMVLEIANALQSETGAPRFTMGGEAFNPADGESYTYNSALTLKGS